MTNEIVNSTDDQVKPKEDHINIYVNISYKLVNFYYHFHHYLSIYIK